MNEDRQGSPRDGQMLSSLSTSIVLRFGNEAKRSRQVNGILAIGQQSEADNSARLPGFFSFFLLHQIASIAFTRDCHKVKQALKVIAASFFSRRHYVNRSTVN